MEAVQGRANYFQVITAFECLKICIQCMFVKMAVPEIMCGKTC